MSGFAKTNWREPLHIRDHAPDVPFDHKHDIQFSLSVLSVVVDDPPVLALAFAFTFSFLLSG